MLVVAIIGVLAAIAMPNYTTFLNKSRRADGTTALLELQQQQARLRNNCSFYAQNLVNTSNFCGANAGATNLKVASLSPDEYYTLAITANSATANAYTATATAQGAQLGDTNCRKLVLTVDGSNPDGFRSSQDADGNTTTNCW
jgi:type IV pilus assembly protein PilE